MSPVSTNLHFHGLTIPPTCHEDDVMKTSVQPGDAPFEYRFRIPQDEQPGLYWYHPHIHGFSKDQVLGGASGALIVEGIERAKKEVAGLPERVFVIRDQDLMHPQAQPAASEPVVPKFMIDRDGDAANNGTGFGKPAKDLSINYVPVPYPDYPPGVIQMRPGERQLWRVSECFRDHVSQSGGPVSAIAATARPGSDGWCAHRSEWCGRARQLANASRRSTGRARGVYRPRASGWRDGPVGDADCGHRSRRRE